MLSIGFIPAARSLIRTWPGPACGVGTSVKTGEPPYPVAITARIGTTIASTGAAVIEGSHRPRAPGTRNRGVPAGWYARLGRVLLATCARSSVMSNHGAFEPKMCAIGRMLEANLLNAAKAANAARLVVETVRRALLAG